MLGLHSSSLGRALRQGWNRNHDAAKVWNHARDLHHHRDRNLWNSAAFGSRDSDRPVVLSSSNLISNTRLVAGRHVLAHTLQAHD
jgi:hypothetical protein